MFSKQKLIAPVGEKPCDVAGTAVAVPVSETGIAYGGATLSTSLRSFALEACSLVTLKQKQHVGAKECLCTALQKSLHACSKVVWLLMEKKMPAVENAALLPCPG